MVLSRCNKIISRLWWVKWQNWVIVRQCTRSSIEIQLPSRIIVGSPGTKLPDISSKEKEGEGPCKSSVRNSWYKRQVRLTQTCYGTFFISLFVLFVNDRYREVKRMIRSESGRRIQSHQTSCTKSNDVVGIYFSLFFFSFIIDIIDEKLILISLYGH